MFCPKTFETFEERARHECYACPQGSSAPPMEISKIMRDEQEAKGE
jgi:hypothetical protein